MPQCTKTWVKLYKVRRYQRCMAAVAKIGSQRVLSQGTA
jgi:hypothetical protein